MASRSGYFNRSIGKWVDSSGGSQYNEDSQPYITRREKLTFTLNVMQTNATTGATEQYTGWASGGPYSFRYFIDNDWNQYIEGDLQTAITAGAISEIKIDNLVTTNATPLATGRIVLTNSSAESEAFDYTSYTEAGGVYTFVVSGTATYNYALDDSADVVDPALIEVYNVDIDQTNAATGVLVITMDADNLAFINAANSAGSAEISGCLFELQVLDGSADLVDSIPGDFRCLNLLVDDFANPPPGPAADYYTSSVSDARFLIKVGAAGGQTAIGGTGAGDDLTLQSTSNATKGYVILGSTSGVVFDEVNNRMSVGGTENTVTIGGTTYGSTFSVHAEGATDVAEYAIHRHSATAGLGGHLVFVRSKGTEAAPTVVASGDYVMRIDGVGHDGTDFELCAQIDMIIDGTVAAGQMPGRIDFLVSPAGGAATPALAMRIDSAKDVTLSEQLIFSVGTNAPVNNSIATVGTDTMAIYGGATDGLYLYSDTVGGATLTLDPSYITFSAATNQSSYTATQILLNENAADIDTIIKGNTDVNLFTINAGADAVCISASAPVGSEKFYVNGVSRFGGATISDSYNDIAEQSAPSTPGSGYGRVYVSTDGALHFINDAGEDIVAAANVPIFKSTEYISNATGTDYEFGFYRAPATSVTLSQASTTQAYGTANSPYGAHAFVVASLAGTATGGSGAVIIKVTGTSITDAGVRTAADTETIVADITAASTDEYFETSKKWIGQITFTIDPGATGHTTYNFTFNYGLAKYEDFGNRDFTVTDFEVVGLGGAADTGFDIELLKHSTTGWTYHATAFVPGNGGICQFSTDYSTESDIKNNEEFAYKRAGLSTTVSGSGSEGVLVRFTTTAVGAIDHSAVHIGVIYS